MTLTDSSLTAPLELDKCIERLYRRELLPEVTIHALCSKLKELLIKESNVVYINTPVTVVGDIHGQFHDLIEIFRIGGFAPDTNYLFLGDYVDRGMFSVETITLLICLKLRYPSRINLIRGNHESRQITQNYGFYSECHRKYGSPLVWGYFTDMFDFLILSVVINDTIFCVHGGLSPNVHSIDQIKLVDRFREIPHEGAMADLVWSDPNDEENDFQLSSRGAGYTFGYDVVKKFLQFNSMDKILRAHQLCNEGYQIYFHGLVTTVWSAPNYCYRCGNRASILEIYNDQQSFFNVFEESPENAIEIRKESDRIKTQLRPVEYFL
ncbi:putative serine/threonine-protein kinase PPG1 [Ascoidea rubescens DSM 1968]|uniref:Serine/threonine-protein phosphatase n=1 Tax=Ascoidea rubescens DSM 1968 TaxID=1344418 RepID=A0A1D2VCL2_9ASCO|nr:serine/threonine-protein phosphatase PP2A catalytic subunit [Ascoidea rubescens DSM 1968]ODV59438.1 serine/threonine-protein phosphatase PP2A catalytic subunit [Ascoidea rubescens DSM 1968]